MKKSQLSSIRHKLITRVTLVLTVAFGIILAIEIGFSIDTATKNLIKTETTIRSSIIAKGNILTISNSHALSGMVADNSFTAVSQLIRTTLKEDKEILYGIFMNDELTPWVIIEQKNPQKNLAKPIPYTDQQSITAYLAKKPSHRILQKDGAEIYEFYAPIYVDGDQLGTIRYGISTTSMRILLDYVRAESRQEIMIRIIGLIITCLTVFILVYLLIRRQAVHITTPLSLLTNAANTIAKGDYSNQIEINSNDEIQLLAQNFNTMRTTIQKKINDLFDINTVGEQLAKEHQQKHAIKMAINAFKKHFSISEAALFLLNDDQKLETVFRFNTQEANIENHRSLDENTEFIQYCFQQNRILENINLNDDNNIGEYIDTKNTPTAFISSPIHDKENPIGVVVLLCDTTNVNFSIDEKQYVRAVTRLLSISLSNIRMNTIIRSQNINLEKTVEERTKSLKIKTQDVFNLLTNLRQGLFTIVSGGFIHHEYSTYLEEIFNTSDIANREFSGFLFHDSHLDKDTIANMKETINLVIGTDDLNYQINKHQLIHEYAIEIAGKTRHLALDWRPIFQDEYIDKIMVTVRNITKQKKYEDKALQKEKELQIVEKLINANKDLFSKFIFSTRKRLTTIETYLSSKIPISIHSWRDIQRELHTIKGNTRTMALAEIATLVHECESDIASYLSKTEIDQYAYTVVCEQIKKHLNSIHDMLKSYENTAICKLGWSIDDLQHEQLSYLNQKRHDKALNGAEQVLHEVKQKNLSIEAQETISQAFLSLQQLTHSPLQKALQPVISSLPSMAEKLAKPTPNIIFDCPGIGIKNSFTHILCEVFNHLFSNALAHGIEDPQVRVEKGKPKVGKIVVSTHCDDSWLKIAIRDDGQGVNVAALLKKHQTESQKHMTSDDDKLELIFKSGLSSATSVTDISGRGIGLDAVRHQLRKYHSDIRAIPLPHEQGDYLPFYLQIELPRNIYCPLEQGHLRDA